MSTPREPLPPAGNAGDPGADDVPRDAALSALYRQLPASVPQAQTDAAILAAARQAVHARPRSLQRWHRWSLPLATAASVLLVLTILHRQEVPELAAPAAVEDAYVQAVPENIAPEMTAPAPVVAAAEAPAVAAAADAPAVPAARAVAKVQALPDAGGTRTGNAGNDDAVRVATPAVAVEESLPATGAGPVAPSLAVAASPAPAAEQREVVARKSVAASERREAMVTGQMAAPPPDDGFAPYVADMTVLSTQDAGDGARLWRLQSPDLALLRTRLAADGWRPLASCPAWPGGAHARGEEEAGWSLPDANGIVTLRVGPGTCPP